ncbi:MAG TPA: DUF1266 domain-containing protein [Terracidiphilus sp.]|nr:DUF1266 domain-containing protein [Terracidiphilus sp.]
MRRWAPATSTLAGVVFACTSMAGLAQVRKGTVAAQSLLVYAQMSTESDTVATLPHGAAVQILFSVTTGDGSWCSVANANSTTKLGYVDCNGLAIETVPGSGPASAFGAGQPPTPQQKAWALAASAIASTVNGTGTRTLAADTPAQAREALAAGWEVHNRDDLFNALSTIEDGQELAIFSMFGQRTSALSVADFNTLLSQLTPLQAKAARLARKYYQVYQSQNLTGWEYARYIDACRWGVSAGYLTPDEAWPRIMSAARLIQQTFGSWQEFGQNYLLGWEIFPTTTVGGPLRESPRAAYEWLISNPNSPWRKTPWNLPLE